MYLDNAGLPAVSRGQGGGGEAGKAGSKVGDGVDKRRAACPHYRTFMKWQVAWDILDTHATITLSW